MRHVGRLCLLLTGALLNGCGPAFWEGMSQGMAASSGTAGAKIMIFGGQGHDTYLGCLSCSEYATDSVFNEYGQHGSEYSTKSIHNEYGQFGSAYSTYSACSPYASDPPVVVDQDGNYYGRLTVNPYHADGTFGDAEFLAWLKHVCEGG